MTGPCLIAGILEINMHHHYETNSMHYRRSQKTHTPNDKNAHLETAAECIPTKQRAKPRVPCETLAIRKKREYVKTASKYKKN